MLMNQPEMDWQIHQTDLRSRFKQVFIHSHWTDCAFRVGNEETEIIRGHKVVLAASSPVFEALFYGTLAEKKEIIDIPDLEPDTFSLLLKYMYYDSTELDSIEVAGQLLYAARKYMMPHLVRACLDYLLEQTCINTLWQVLAIAEDMHEDELLASCLKVMCQYPGEMWVNNHEHMGLGTLSNLLDQPSTNLLEVELWELMVRWARDQCLRRTLAPSPTNQRALITQAGLLGKIRFLTLTLAELTEMVEPTGLLSQEEMRVLRQTINKSSSPSALPSGFNSTREMRKRFMSISSRCTRHCLTKRKKYTYGGTVMSTVSVDSRILVTGFEVFTRIATSSDYIMGHGCVSHYVENLVVTLSDSEGNVIDKTKVSGVVAFFNVTQEVNLSRPVWFLPQHEYTVTFELSPGQYPLSDLASIAFSKSVCFRFRQCKQCDEINSDLDVSFINSVIFNV
ncbi:BTB/POZ domain-containing protein 3-like isoform X2 [Homalodisca vitripennis]|uniref:BTB/POZ domain-containing protein 3-like isoform X2 n=1 Tax=Homalodisca vitripennis TaxID=197043 RepID=UPI001EEB1DF4|nr:BTB/POZ domain-containing protein 3-like isoform X2 [Homalodisca vitripennis]